MLTSAAVWSLSLAAAAKIARVLLAIFLTLLDRFFFSFFTTRDPPVKRVAVIGGGIAGFGAAWALARSGVEVTLLEAADEVGGNAKTIAWPDGKVTGLSVLAWPAVYFRNYKALLRALGIETPVELPFYIRRADGEAFAHGRATRISLGGVGDLRRWSYLVAFVRRTNAFFAGKGALLSLYHMSLLNPLNAVPLRVACALVISSGFYHDLIVPLYASSLPLDRSRDDAAGDRADHRRPDLDARRPLHGVGGKASSRDVFSRMAADTACIGALKVRAGRRVGFAFRDPADGRWALTCIGAEPEFFSGFDRVVFAGRARGGRRAAEYVGVDRRAAPPAFGRLLRRAGVRQGSRAHSDASVLPADPVPTCYGATRITLRSSAAAAAKGGRYENTFILSSWYPAVQSDDDGDGGDGDDGREGRLSSSLDVRPPPMARLVTYDCRHPERLKGVVGEVRNEWNHPVLSPLNLRSSRCSSASSRAAAAPTTPARCRRPATATTCRCARASPPPPPSARTTRSPPTPTPPPILRGSAGSWACERRRVSAAPKLLYAFLKPCVQRSHPSDERRLDVDGEEGAAALGPSPPPAARQ